MRRVICGLVFLIPLLALLGCNVQLGKEGGALRPAKRPERARYSPESTYRGAYAAWQVNHNTIVEQLEQSSFPRNNLRIKGAAEDAGWALRTMQANLPEGKGKELDPIIDGYNDAGQKAMQRVSSSVLMAKMRGLYSQVVRGFAPEIVPIVAPKDE